MANLPVPANPADATFSDACYRIEAADSVLGFQDGNLNIANLQAARLIENDVWLKRQIEQTQNGQALAENSVTRAKVARGVLPVGVPRNTVVYGSYDNGVRNLVYVAPGNIVTVRPCGLAFAGGYDDKGPVDYFARLTEDVAFSQIVGTAAATMALVAELNVSTGAVTIVGAYGTISYRPSAPLSPANGDYWYNQLEEVFYKRVAGAWQPVLAVVIGQVSQSGGTYSAAVTYEYRRDVNMFSAQPAGIIEAFAGVVANIPDGYLLCNGAELEIARYPRLFAAIGTTWGNPGAGLFQLPDLRGEFIRGLDNGRGIDTGRVLGSAQAQAIQAHTHSFSGNNRVGISNTAYGSNSTLAANMLAGSPTTSPVSDSTGGTETRPRNIAMNYIIRF